MNRSSMRTLVRWLAPLLALALLAACATPPPPGSNVSGMGVVQAISETQQASAGAGMAGAIGGAVLGGLLGSTIGGGTGQTIATATGSVVGSAAGGAAAANAGTTTVWNVTIRFDDGIDRLVTVAQPPNVRPGDRVSVSNGVISPAR
ncbi:hypothetical protein [Rivibacter subsaxonicus]|uniref:Outer membrane lipoprotein SlyB n=1 Tax=Rivibacter subsaxonicus TaxID=457575 RepID=A0A4Q7VZV0_9BURK|nr:hypothetical protein [Rivibacter subsaxonicus]RZU02330.1 outer membrane lipoprotein SlyB [Rivibacter subsaxonicus]